MDFDCKLHKRIISLTKITSHKGIDIGKTLDACLTDWGIHKVFTITINNASTDDGVVKYMAQSLKAMNTLMLDGKYLHMNKMANVQMDVPTRYNATYKMLERAFKYRQVFDKMAYSCEVFQTYFLEEKRVEKVMVKRVGLPKDDDWEKALVFVHFLKKIYDATLKLSATKTCTSLIIFLELVRLQVQIEAKMKDPRNSTMQRVASTMKLKFDKYWGSF
ncbi:hypothetical protein ACE6H2_001671 [Prunus campanulata]